MVYNLQFQIKKTLTCQSVLNIFEFDENNIEIHEAIIDIKKCLDQIFFQPVNIYKIYTLNNNMNGTNKYFFKQNI